MQDSDILAIAPFSRKAAEILEEQGVTIEDLALDPLFERARLMARERLVNAIIGKHDWIVDRANPMNEVYSFIAAKLIAANVGRSVLNKLAVYESKRFSKLSEDLPIDRLKEIAIETFGLSIEGGEVLWIDVPGFLRASCHIGGVKWRLVNRIVKGGKVMIDRADLRRLLAEYVRISVIETPKIELPDPLKRTAEEVSLLYKARMRRRTKKPKKGDFPPCIRALIDRLRRGENLTHQARFTLATFLLKVGWTEEQVLDLFRNLPDFNEKITSYQISHIAKKKYMPPNCDTMRSWGLCPEECGRKYMLEGL